MWNIYPVMACQIDEQHLALYRHQHVLFNACALGTDVESVVRMDVCVV